MALDAPSEILAPPFRQRRHASFQRAVLGVRTCGASPFVFEFASLCLGLLSVATCELVVRLGQRCKLCFTCFRARESLIK